jgi:hypothetical protein
MAMRFPYVRFGSPLPVVPLGGQMFRPRPVVSVGVLGRTTTKALDALLDTGSDDTVFPEQVAEDIGLDLTHAPTRHLSGIGPSGYRVRYAQVRVRLSDGFEFREWPATVAFTDAPLPFATLGFAGCLQFFTATFHGDLAEVELAVDTLYPGT